MTHDERIKWKLERIQKGIKIKDIAKRIGISSSYICAHENSRDTLSIWNMRKYKEYISNVQLPSK